MIVLQTPTAAHTVVDLSTPPPAPRHRRFPVRVSATKFVKLLGPFGANLQLFQELRSGEAVPPVRSVLHTRSPTHPPLAGTGLPATAVLPYLRLRASTKDVMLEGSDLDCSS